MHWLDYRERLKIGYCDAQKYEHFLTKIFNFLEAFMYASPPAILTYGEYLAYCNVTGTKLDMRVCDNDDSALRYRWLVAELKSHSKILPEFLAYYMAFVNALDETRNDDWGKQDYLGLVQNMLRQSKIPVELIQDEEGYFLFPKGAEELDYALVSEPFVWLGEYSKTRKAYVKALEEYSEVNESNASDVADKFRKTLETFMQEFFDTDKSLENCKPLYGAYLKSQGVPGEIAGNFETLLQAYANFMNNYAKHHDKTGLNVLEYIMYQTGNIIRLIITLKQAELV